MRGYVKMLKYNHDKIGGSFLHWGNYRSINPSFQVQYFNQANYTSILLQTISLGQPLILTAPAGPGGHGQPPVHPGQVQVHLLPHHRVDLLLRQ